MPGVDPLVCGITKESLGNDVCLPSHGILAFS